jgi:hypothetical protein
MYGAIKSFFVGSKLEEPQISDSNDTNIDDKDEQAMTFPYTNRPSWSDFSLRFPP